MNGGRLSSILSQAWNSRHNCVVCNCGDNEDTLLLCDGCDKGSHFTCIGLSKLPDSEEWFCDLCVAAKTKSCLKVVAVVEPVEVVEPVFEVVNIDQMSDLEYANYQFYKYLLPSGEEPLRDEMEKLYNHAIWAEFMDSCKEAVAMYKKVARQAHYQVYALQALSNLFKKGGVGITLSEEKAARYKKFATMALRAQNQVATRQDDKFYFLADNFYNEKKYFNAMYYYDLCLL